MATDGQVRKLFRDLGSEKWLAVAARRAGMDEKTARKYRELGCLPSDQKQPRTYRTRIDPLAQLWPRAQARLEAVPRLRAKPHPKTRSFFRRTDFDTEAALRHDAHKWETTLHRQQNFLPASLQDPFFDVHYQTRQAGKASRGSEKIRYALIITVRAPKIPNLYDRIVQRYRTQLEPLRPIIEVPVRLG